MRLILAGLALAIALTGCGKSSETVSSEAGGATGGYAVVDQDRAQDSREEFVDTAALSPASPPPPPAPMAGEAARPTTSTSAPSQPAGPAPVLYLAYSYQVGLEIPSERLIGVMDAHVRACQTAGPRLCQLINSNRSGDPESFMQGNVALRAEPAWLRTFMSGLEAQADAAGGRMIAQATTSEDLTRAIVDTEARLRAQSTLRDRLQRLLESRPGRLADLLEVERELARVQADIDSVQSNLAVMRTRVSMSELTLSYQSSPRSVGSDTFEPLRNAFANFLGLIVGGFAVIITIIAGALPFVIVFGLIGWGVLAWRRRNGGRIWRREPRTPAPEAPKE